MYFEERWLHKFKSSIRNRGQPEGSMAEKYLIEECMTLCSRYLHRIETKFNRLDRNDDEYVGVKKKLLVFSHIGRPLGLGKVCNLDSSDRDRAHLYVLKNCKEISSFFRYMWFSFVLIVNCEVYEFLFDMTLITQFVMFAREHSEMLA